MINVYANIRETAKSQKISIRSIEAKAGLSTGSICKWSVCNPSVAKLKKVADVLGVSMDSLMRETPQE